MRAKNLPRSLFAVIAASIGCASLAGRPAGADTVHLKSGGSIYDCQVVREDAGTVLLRTPQGKMGVPRSMVASIVKAKTVFDSYEGQRSHLRDDDAEGMFRLAEWCRATAGLRPEMTELLQKVIELKPDHAGARRRLGHVRVDGKWRVPPLLTLRVRVPGDKEVEDDLGTQLSYFLEDRADIRMAVGALKSAPKGTDGCDIVASTSSTIRPGTKFFGVDLERAKSRAYVTLKAQADWLPGGSLEITVGSGGNLAMASGRSGPLVDALRQNAKYVHDFLDNIAAKRADAIEAAAAPKTTADPPAEPAKKTKDAKGK